VAQAVTTEANDKRSLLPLAEAAKAALGGPAELHVVADAGYSNGQQAEACEQKGIVPHVAVQRSINNQGDGSAFGRSQFPYDAEHDRFCCPAGQTLERKGVKKERTRILYQARAEACGGCALKARCTQARRRTVYRHLHERRRWSAWGSERPQRPCACGGAARNIPSPA